uniref:Uncharacterized protein n=1 Tax=Coturnix japonica TaxID=93934 RepID=A0A8C2ST80_COTJA
MGPLLCSCWPYIFLFLNWDPQPLGFYRTPPSCIVSYGTRIVSYGTPIVSYGTPIGFYGTPAISYGTPIVSYGAPIGFYGTPVVSYGTPIVSYGTPIRFYGTPLYPMGPPLYPMGPPLCSMGSIVSYGTPPVISYGTPIMFYGIYIYGTPTPLGPGSSQVLAAHRPIDSIGLGWKGPGSSISHPILLFSVHQWAPDVRRVLHPPVGRRAAQRGAGDVSQLPLRDQQEPVLQEPGRGEGGQ